MGLFQHKHDDKKSPEEEMSDAAQQVFDDTFREELRQRGRQYFEKVIIENAALFKQDLDATISQVNTELEVHIIRKVDEQLVEHVKAMKQAQDSALQSMNKTVETINDDTDKFKKELDHTVDTIKSDLSDHATKLIDDQMDHYGASMKEAQVAALQTMSRSAQTVQEQYQQLGATLEKSIASQDAEIRTTYQQASAQLTSMQEAQNAAVQSLNATAKALQEQYELLSVKLAKDVADQEAIMIGIFQQNMAQIVEHYLLEALGDAFDLKAQLPAIIKQMESSKQAMVDDLKL